MSSTSHLRSNPLSSAATSSMWTWSQSYDTQRNIMIIMTCIIGWYTGLQEILKILPLESSEKPPLKCEKGIKELASLLPDPRIPDTGK